MILDLQEVNLLFYLCVLGTGAFILKFFQIVMILLGHKTFK